MSALAWGALSVGRDLPQGVLALFTPSLIVFNQHGQTSVRIVRNQENALHFFSTGDQTAEHSVPCKVSCNICRSPMFDEGRNTVLAYPSSFQFSDGKIPLDFYPTAHIFYSQRSDKLYM